MALLEGNLLFGLPANIPPDMAEAFKRIAAQQAIGLGDPSTMPFSGIAVQNPMPEMPDFTPKSDASDGEPAPANKSLATPVDGPYLENQKAPDTVPLPARGARSGAQAFQTTIEPAAPPIPAAPVRMAQAAPSSDATPDFAPSFGQRLTAFGNALTGHAGADLGEQQRARQSTYKALTQMGMSPDMAEAAVRNPEFGAAILANQFTKTQLKPTGTVTKDGHPVLYDASRPGLAYDAVTGQRLTGKEELTSTRTGGLLSDETAKSIAERYVATGDRMAMSALGYGPAAGQNRAKVQEYITQLMRERKISPEEMGNRVAEWEARKASQRVIGTSEGKILVAAKELEGTLPIAAEAIDKVPRTGFLPFNRLIQGYYEQTLSPEQAQLAVVTQTVVNVYAAVMSRGATVVSDTARKHAADLLNTASNPEAYKAVLQMLQREATVATQSPERVREFYRKNYGPQAVVKTPEEAEFGTPGTEGGATTFAPAEGVGAQAPAAAPQGVTGAAGTQSNPIPVTTPTEALKLPKGTYFTTPDGRVKVRP